MSSNLIRVTIFYSVHTDYGRIAQLVRALASHARGHGFESPCVHQKKMHPDGCFFYFQHRGHEPRSGESPRTIRTPTGVFLFGSLFEGAGRQSLTEGVSRNLAENSLRRAGRATSLTEGGLLVYA